MKNTDYFKLLEVKPRISISLAFVLVANILIWVNTNYIVGLLFSILVAGVLFMANGYVIDKENNRIQKITFFLGFTFGKWYALPQVKYISVVRVRMTRKGYQLSSAMFVNKSSNNYAYRVNLVIEDSGQKPFRIISISSRRKAIEKSLKLAEYLNVSVYDSSTPERRWLN